MSGSLAARRPPRTTARPTLAAERVRPAALTGTLACCGAAGKENGGDVVVLTPATAGGHHPRQHPTRESTGGTPQLRIAKFQTPPVVEFQRVQVGHQCSRQLRLVNPSPATQSLSIDSVPFQAGVSVEEAQLSVPPRGADSLTIHWRPVVAGGVRERLRFAWAGRVPLEVILVGVAVEPAAPTGPGGVVARPNKGRRAKWRQPLALRTDTNEAAPAGASAPTQKDGSPRVGREAVRKMANRARESSRRSRSRSHRGRPTSEGKGSQPQPAASMPVVPRGRRVGGVDARWQDKQEAGFTSWLNHCLLQGEDGEDAGSSAGQQPNALQLLVRTRQEAAVRREAFRLMQSPAFQRAVDALDEVRGLHAVLRWAQQP